MAIPARDLRPLPDQPAQARDEGWNAALTTRIIIVLSVLLGQLWALTVALEEYLSGHGHRAWWLAGFSLLSFAVVGVLVWLEPPSRAQRRRPGRR